jgi:hypothetical protein
MQHRSIRACLLASVGFVFAAGCDTIEINHHAKLEERATSLAEAYCAAYQSCDCPFAGEGKYPEPDECLSKEKARLLSAFEKAEEEDLEFDQGCMDQLLARYQALGCESIPSMYVHLGTPELAENFGCALYHGDEVDGVCAIVGGTSWWSDCAAGRTCADNECRPVFVSKGEGGECAFGGLPYSSECQPGLVCDQFEGCEPGGQTGDPCLGWGDGSQQCLADHYCDELVAEEPEGICQPLVQGGEPCPIDGSGNEDICHGRCEPDPNDPSVGACVDIPAVCEYMQLRPPV